MHDRSSFKQALEETVVIYFFSYINLKSINYSDQKKLLSYKCMPVLYSVYQNSLMMPWLDRSKSAMTYLGFLLSGFPTKPIHC